VGRPSSEGVLSEEEIKTFLENDGYRFAHVFPDGRWAALRHFMFTIAIIVGTVETMETGYEDRWCYHSLDQAIEAYVRWIADEGVGEPDGWHRHPSSGRRRDPDTGSEWIAP
jgi:hypothetical protein